MVRGSKNKKQTRLKRSRTLLLSALTAAALASGLGISGVHPAQAAGYVYQQHTLNAGVLVNGTDPAPYLFYVLNNRPDVRPVDLNLVNPLAPAGADPKTAAYWEVSLNNVSDSEMAQYNVLYLRADGITFSPNINEKLRRFVDNGGQLIVEYGNAVSPAVAGLFTGSAPGTLAATMAGVPPVGAAFLRHPIITQPYLLSDTDVTGLGSFTFDIGVNTLDPIHGTKTAGAPSEYSNTFSPVLNGTGGTLLAAAQIGGGQAVVSALNLGPNTSGHNTATFTAADLYSASPAQTPDLKLLANIITWSQTHPSENKTSHSNTSNVGLASFSPAWQYLLAPPAATPSAPSGASVWGNFVFAVDANGVLRAFDAYPSENLTLAATNISFGTAQTDDGPVIDYSTGTSYDEIWEQSGFSGASTPTVASFGGVNYVFVEKRDGTLAAFNAVTKAAYALPAAPVTSPGSYPQGQVLNAPAPTFYDGRLYAGQTNGTLHVYDLNEGTSAVVTLNPSPPTTGSEPVTAAPSVGTLADGDVNVLVAVVPTTYNVYSVLLGGRNEPLSAFYRNGAQAGYSISRSGRYELPNLFADVNLLAVPALLAYDYNGNVSNQQPNRTATANTPQDPLFAITNNAGYYTDWNMDFANAGGTNTPPTPVNLNFINASNYDQRASPTPATAMSAPAIDRHGSYYYTETITSTGGTGGVTGSYTNSYLVGVTNAPLYSHVQLKFRFRMPTAADGSTWLPNPYVDGDNVNYNDTNYNKTGVNVSLVGYQFVGAPVIDDQDNIYVAATNVSGTLATVLCFRGDQPISAVAPSGVTPPPDLSQDKITQKDEAGGDDNYIHPGPDSGIGTASPIFGQYLAFPPVTDTSGVVTAPSSIRFYNFGLRGQTAQQIVGDLTEPQPLTANVNDGTPTLPVTLNMQTNLAWFVAPFPLTSTTVNGTPTVSQIAGLTQVGSSLLLTDGASLYRLSTNPQVGASKVVSVALSVTPLGVSNGTATNAGVGAVASVPSVGGSVLVINTTGGIAARTRQVTVIADNNRILGVDGDGSAVWGIDATTRTDTTQTPSVSTKVSFNRPTALSQFAINDYLVADTGNNRCVRFDSAGNVRWELTRFQDPYGLMGAGQPLTLSQPSSVMTRPAFVLPSTDLLYPGGTATPYLLADSGNNRVLEVSDIVDTSGILHSHILTWASHTGDRYGRSYRYGNAAYYKNPATAATGSGISIAATVTNTRLAPLLANSNTIIGGVMLGPVSGDAPGGSLVVFNYPPPYYPARTPPNTLSYPVPFNNLANVPNDLVYTTAGFYAQSFDKMGKIVYTPFTIRSPRFLQLASSLTASVPVNPNPNNVPAFDFLYADDNGAFDLSYDAAKQAFVAGADRLQFKTSDYQTMNYPIAMIATTVPAIGVPNTIVTTTSAGTTTSYTNLRQSLPFVPTCIQALSLDSQPGMTGTLRRYLITQNYTQGELGSVYSTTTGTAPYTVVTNTGKLGGEVFEVDVSYSTSSGTGTVTTPGGFGSSTLSHPALTGPLTQPTYAVRLP